MAFGSILHRSYIHGIQVFCPLLSTEHTIVIQMLQSLDGVAVTEKSLSSTTAWEQIAH